MPHVELDWWPGLKPHSIRLLVVLLLFERERERERRVQVSKEQRERERERNGAPLTWGLSLRTMRS